jgi:leader peptidase (prepilin peptidase)/N-methyltransferase
MQNIFIIFSFILGTIIGSFLNVVALRFNTGMTLKGRSKCFSCGKNLEWHELIPLFSFMFQKGECKKCSSKISWQYPVIELLAGVLFLLIFYYFPPVDLVSSINTVFYLIITCILLVITIYDVKHKIIPDSLVYTFAFITFAKLFISPDLSIALPNTLDLIAGPALALPFALIWLFSKGTWMGLGDAKLVLGIGWTLGLVAGISAITLAFWIGAVLSVLWMYIVMKKFKAKYEIPFGPFLILGMYLVLFFGIRVIDFSL